MHTPDAFRPAPPHRVSRGGLALEVETSAGGVQLALADRIGPLADVLLAIVVDGVDLGRGAVLTGVETATLGESWTAALGKATGRHEIDHEEHVLRLETGGVRWAIVLRIADDGIAFRYELPAGATELGDERTLIRPRAEGPMRAWVLDYQTWYETPRFGADLAELPEGDYGFPVLVRVDSGRHLLLTESDIDGCSSGAHAVFDGTGFSVVAADPTIEVEGLHRTPWRVLMTGGLREIVRSHLVDALAPAAAPDAFQPRPGRAAWSWWSSQYSGAYLDVQKRFTDFAAEQGWEHLLVDCGWDAAWVPELVAYASARGIQVHLWSSWADLDGAEALGKLALWRSWGVAGIKVDFMESESRERYRWYDAIIAETARVGLMVNFHGSVIPRGWARTHPHVVSYEAVRGAEYYVFYGQPLTAAHNVILPFTRNVVGSMDYTPVAFGAPGRETSDGHELALGVVFESGITHFADDPDRYRERPDAAALLAELPAVWHEVRLQGGDPDSHVVIARRHHDRWFVGGITCRETASDMVVDTRTLIDGPVDVWVVADSGNGGLASIVHERVEGEVRVAVDARGGFAMVVAPSGAALRTAAPRRTRTAPRVVTPLVQLDENSVELVASADELRTPPGWSAERTADESWTVRPDRPTVAGELAVFTFEEQTDDGVPVIAHARVVVPLPRGEHRLSALPFLAARNAVGPVERDLANGGGDPRDGAELTVHAVVHPDGIGVSQASDVRFALAGAAQRLTGFVAVDDETPTGAATAVVCVDGVEVARIPLAAADDPHPLDIDLRGATELALITEPGADGVEAHIDWLAMRVHVD